MSSSLLDPPPSSLDPLLFIWEKERSFIRCHNARYGATEFNPGKGDGRFHPFLNPLGKFVSTLYAANHLEGALSETVFRDVPVRGPDKRVGRFVLEPLVASTLVCERDLFLAQLFGFGLRRLGITRLELIESESDQYPRTRAWAKALHACDKRVDGLVWVSRQHDGTRSVVLFGDRVPESAIRVVGDSLPLKDGLGYEAVVSAAAQAGILLFE